MPGRYGDFEILEQLGASEWADDYRAMHDKLGGPYFVKRFSRLPRAYLPSLKQRCERLMRLKHPALAPHLGHGEAEGSPFVVSPWLEGVSLTAFIGSLKERRVTLPLDGLLYILRELASAVGGLQSGQLPDGSPLTHGDVTANHVRLGPGGEVWLTGLATPRDLEPGKAPEPMWDGAGVGATAYDLIGLTRPGQRRPPLPPALNDLVRRALGIGTRGQELSPTELAQGFDDVAGALGFELSRESIRELAARTLRALSKARESHAAPVDEPRPAPRDEPVRPRTRTSEIAAVPPSEISAVRTRTVETPITRSALSDEPVAPRDPSAPKGRTGDPAVVTPREISAVRTRTVETPVSRNALSEEPTSPRGSPAARNRPEEPPPAAPREVSAVRTRTLETPVSASEPSDEPGPSRTNVPPSRSRTGEHVARGPSGTYRTMPPPPAREREPRAGAPAPRAAAPSPKAAPASAAPAAGLAPGGVVPPSGGSHPAVPAHIDLAPLPLEDLPAPSPPPGRPMDGPTDEITRVQPPGFDHPAHGHDLDLTAADTPFSLATDSVPSLTESQFDVLPSDEDFDDFLEVQETARHAVQKSVTAPPGRTPLDEDTLSASSSTARSGSISSGGGAFVADPFDEATRELPDRGDFSMTLEQSPSDLDESDTFALGSSGPRRSAEPPPLAAVDDKAVNALLNRGRLTRLQIAAALELQQEQGGELLQIVLTDTSVSDTVVADTLALDSGNPRVDEESLKQLLPREPIRRRLPQTYAMSRRVLPLAVHNDVLSVAMVNPYDERTLRDLATIFGVSSSRVLVATQRDLLGAIRAAYPVLGPLAEPAGGVRVLICVADDKIAERLGSRFALEGFTIEHATSAGLAERIIAARAPDVILAASHLPDGPASALLARVRSSDGHEERPFFVFGPEDEALEEQILDLGGDDFFEEPLNYDIVVKKVRRAGKRAIKEFTPALGAQIPPPSAGPASASPFSEADDDFGAVIEAPIPAEPTGVMGTLRQMAVSDIVQSLELGKKTARVELVPNDGEKGTFTFEFGTIVHAECGPLVGPDAFYEMARHKEGFFRIHYGARAEGQNVEIPTTFLLLEAMRRLDEESLT